MYLTTVDAAKPPHTSDSQVDKGLDGVDMVDGRGRGRIGKKRLDTRTNKPIYRLPMATPGPFAGISWSTANHITLGVIAAAVVFPALSAVVRRRPLAAAAGPLAALPGLRSICDHCVRRCKYHPRMCIRPL